MAELHIIGQISSARNFKQPRLLCKWNFYVCNGWKVVSGHEEGQTQESCDLYTNNPIWDHPVDLYYTTQTLQNSPKLLLQVFCRDNYGRILFLSYGVHNIPLSPGSHTLECHTWKPIGNWKDRLHDKFLGRTLQLKSPSVLINTVDRFEILTQSMGTVIVHLHILARNFDKFGFLTSVNVARVKKIEDVLICTNDTDCSESDLTIQNPKVDDSALGELSNDTEEASTASVTASSETTAKITFDVTEQPELQSTTISSTTVAVPLNNNPILGAKRKDICECDLTRSSCDVNCCCDIDCNQFHLSAFSHCQEDYHELYDSRYCYNRNFIQRNNTPFIFEKLANNLFCILYDNLPPTYSVDNDSILKNAKDLWKTVQMRRYTWKVEHGKVMPKYNLSKHYQHGDVLWKLHESSIEAVEFPQTGFSGTCSFTKTVRYLENWKGACVQNKLTNANRYLFATTFNNFTIISSLPSFNDTFVSKQTCRGNVCLPVKSHYCLNSFSTCNESGISGVCTNSTCINVVKGLKYVIAHNGSAGVHSIDAYLDIGNASHAFYQYFEVRYHWAGTNETKALARSGNPGYLLGKPIVVGSRVNESEGISFNKTNGFLTLPVAGKSGECDRIDRYLIAFGEDVRSRCSVRLSVKNFTVSSCAELQNLTTRLLTKDSLLSANQSHGIYVSKRGNFTSRSSDEWSRVAFDRLPQSVVTAHASGKQILCSGLITSLRVDVIYSTLPKPKGMTNHKILGAAVTFGKEEDVSWRKCGGKNCTDILSVDVISYVNFHDVSKTSKYHFVGGSNLDITLPYDFFYPFLNGSEKMEVSNVLILLIIYYIGLT
ncbi:B9 domain-containing protein [Ooceraea biroi]|uniref:B9 domain-containing protein n=1 Tax=Ooceraea biroi TaxID=2015173 RepID=A0A026X0K8_OOCBI|nr:B9 domain-containing protein [Ooceraea biroi]